MAPIPYTTRVETPITASGFFVHFLWSVVLGGILCVALTPTLRRRAIAIVRQYRNMSWKERVEVLIPLFKLFRDIFVWGDHHVLLRIWPWPDDSLLYSFTKGPPSHRSHTCSHCWSEMLAEEPTILHDECGNAWHRQCLLEWIDSRKVGEETCPICRQSLKNHGTIVRARGNRNVLWRPRVLARCANRLWALALFWLGVTVLLFYWRHLCPPDPSIMFAVREAVLGYAVSRLVQWWHILAYFEGHRMALISRNQINHQGLRYGVVAAPIVVLHFTLRYSRIPTSMSYMSIMSGFVHGIDWITESGSVTTTVPLVMLWH